VDYRKLAVRLPKDHADRFASAMRSRGHRTEASALRALIDPVLAAADPNAATEKTAPERPAAKGRTRRLWVHVREEEAREIRAMASPFGGVAAWFRGIVDARLGRASELPARPEIEALHHATVQLGRLGTNLNQIARALNTARLAGEPVEAERVRLDELAELKAAVNDVANRANAVIFAARRRVFNE
jgi:hypothetical protein